MLVLTRKTGQQICVPCCGVSVEVLGVSNKHVRLGIRAPSDVIVHRREVLQRIEKARSRESYDGKGSNEVERVLITDSDPRLLRASKAHLQQSGLVVDTATSGLDCVAHLRREAPDVLVLAPEIWWGGVAGVLSLMLEDPDIPLVPTLIHGHDETQCQEAAKMYPLFRYVMGPLRPTELKTQIELFDTCLQTRVPDEDMSRGRVLWLDALERLRWPVHAIEVGLRSFGTVFPAHPPPPNGRASYTLEQIFQCSLLGVAETVAAQ